MTSAGRIYVAIGTVLVFFVLWATVAAHPWATATTDTRVAALARREAVVRREAALAQQRYAARWAAYRATLKERAVLAAATPVAPRVRIVTLPAVATTRTS